MEDRQIVELFLRREEAAIDQAREKYGARLRALALGVTEDFQTAEECENDTYLAAWNAIPPQEPRDYLYAFLARIVRHIALNRCREAGRLKRGGKLCALSAEMEQSIPAPDDLECRLAEGELKRAINGFLGELKPEARKIFLRRYFFLDSIADISRRLGLTESKVKTSLFRSRKKLRDYLIKEGYTL